MAAEVGGNLQDHLDYTVVRAVPDRNLVGINPGWLRQMMPEWQRWKRHGRGRVDKQPGRGRRLPAHRPGAGPAGHPDPFRGRDGGRSRPQEALARGLSCHVCVLRPRSRGTVRLAEQGDEPVIDPGYLSDPADLGALATGVEIVRKVMDAPALAA